MTVWFHQCLSKVYELPGFVFVFFMMLAVLGWGTLGHVYAQRKWWLIVNRVAATLTVAAVLAITLLVRGKSGEAGVVLELFAAWKAAKEYPDVYNQMMLNVVLFFPLGLTLPYAQGLKAKHPLLLTMGAATLLSVSVELLQWVSARGYTELNDILLNAAGAAIGLLAYGLGRKLTA